MRRIALAVVGLLLAGCAEQEQRRVRSPAGTSVTSVAHGFTLRLPAGWGTAGASLTPHLGNPVEIVSAGTMRDMRASEGECAHVPVGALERMGPRDAFVTVQERFGSARFPARPAHFALAGERDNDARYCARNGADLELHWFGFGDAGRKFHVLAAFGREAPPQRHAEALALLDSLRFEPGPEGVELDPDRTVFERWHGLAWQLPVPPWRHYAWPQTAVAGEALALGTFPLRRSPPDSTCAPRAALAAMPPGGVFILVFALEAAGEEVPARSGVLALGPELRHECVGTSRMVRWRDGGRTLQAHVVTGPQATDERVAEARSILNSIRAG